MKTRNPNHVTLEAVHTHTHTHVALREKLEYNKIKKKEIKTHAVFMYFLCEQKNM